MKFTNVALSTLILSAGAAGASTTKNVFCGFAQVESTRMVGTKTAADIAGRIASRESGRFALALNTAEQAVAPVAPVSRHAVASPVTEVVMANTFSEDVSANYNYAAPHCEEMLNPALVVATVLENFEKNDIVALCAVNGSGLVAADAAAQLLRSSSGAISLNCIYARK